MFENSVKIERFRPDYLHNKPHFTNLVTSQSGKTIYVSGLWCTFTPALTPQRMR
jgi:hypothetical protein